MHAERPGDPAPGRAFRVTFRDAFRVVAARSESNRPAQQLEGEGRHGAVFLSLCFSLLSVSVSVSLSLSLSLSICLSLSQCLPVFFWRASCFVTNFTEFSSCKVFSSFNTWQDEIDFILRPAHLPLSHILQEPQPTHPVDGVMSGCVGHARELHKLSRDRNHYWQ